MFTIPSTILVLIDVQNKLAELMHEKQTLFNNLQILVKGMQILDVPIIWLEQNPLRMGRTIDSLRDLLSSQEPIPKMSFSCCGDNTFKEQLEASGRKQVLLAGIETHVCVYQTARDLAGSGYEVEVVADAVSSRTPDNKLIGLDKIKACGVQFTSVEMILFELMRTAERPAFREILKIVK